MAIPYYLLLSRSITHAQRMSAALEKAGVPGRYFRPPMALADRGCGYAVRVAEHQMSLAMERLRSEGLLPARIFRFDSGGAASEVTFS